MSKARLRPLAMATLLLLLGSPAWAQLAVIDVPAIAQLIQQLQAMEQAVQTAESQLIQARQALQTMTGGRGMELLLSGTVRNYLPSTWAQLASTMQGLSGAAPALSLDVQDAVSQNAILTAQQISYLGSVSQQQIVSRRAASALRQALAKQALANASGRFASIQVLIDAIGSAADQKAILDLQARIAAELGMLQNEQTKLQILQQTMEAQEAADRQQERERVVAGHGSFATRFQPSP